MAGNFTVTKQEGYGLQSAEYAPVSYLQAQVKFYRLIQGREGRGHTVSGHLKHQYDMVNLTKLARGNLDGVPTLIVVTTGMRGLCGFFPQIVHEDDKPVEITDYGNPTLAELQAVHDHAYEAYIAVSMILSLDRSIYGKLMEDLSKSYSMGTYQYPRTCAKM